MRTHNYSPVFRFKTRRHHTLMRRWSSTIRGGQRDDDDDDPPPVPAAIRLPAPRQADRQFDPGLGLMRAA
jgi:hypothetical protein